MKKQTALANKKVISKKKTVVSKVVAKKVSIQKTNTLLGKKVPVFSLDSTGGTKISSKSLLGSRYVLYFYPKDMTSGCTVEAHEFTALAKKFATRGIQVFGVSPDTIESHHKFIAKEGITFPLLADVGHIVAEKFGIWVEKSMYGKKYMGINRSTFIVGASGLIEEVYRDVKPEGHAVCVLEDLVN